VKKVGKDGDCLDNDTAGPLKQGLFPGIIESVRELLGGREPPRITPFVCCERLSERENE
jgi:hypothetical protein